MLEDKTQRNNERTILSPLAKYSIVISSVSLADAPFLIGVSLLDVYRS